MGGAEESSRWTMAQGMKTGGRRKGTANKATAEIREHAQQYTVEALEVLAHVAQHGESESARVSAACALLDRGHGRPTQAVNVGADSSMAALMARIPAPASPCTLGSPWCHRKEGPGGSGGASRLWPASVGCSV